MEGSLATSHMERGGEDGGLMIKIRRRVIDRGSHVAPLKTPCSPSRAGERGGEVRLIIFLVSASHEWECGIKLKCVTIAVVLMLCICMLCTGREGGVFFVGEEGAEAELCRWSRPGCLF